MDPSLQKALLDRVYDKRKAATLDLEKQVRDALAKGDRARVNLIIQQLCGFLNSPSPQNVNARNGGLIGLAGISIALSVEIAPYLEQIVPPVLACFTDPDSKIRYFACESFYNIAKVCKGEILIYFNEIFDSLSKLAADSEVSVKNGAELLDRLLKDIICETAPEYISHFQDIPRIRSRQDAAAGHSGGAAELDIAREKAHFNATGAAQKKDQEATAANKTFSLARFVPLLAERMYVLSPFTRNYLVGWITVLDSVPDLELVSYLPHFLDGLLKYLSDPNTDVRLATANVLAEFLKEIKEAAAASASSREVKHSQGPSGKADAPTSHESQAEPQVDREDPEHDAEAEENTSGGPDKASHEQSEAEEFWIPGREVRIDFASIIEILINHITYPDEEIQAMTLQWMAELLLVVKDVLVPFTPRLIPAILPNLAHHSPAIQAAANDTNVNLYRVIQYLPAPVAHRPQSPPRADSPVDAKSVRAAATSNQATPSRTQEPTSAPVSPQTASSNLDTGKEQDVHHSEVPSQVDPFDYNTTVNMLALQLLDQHEETRVTALEWLIMLHQKAPQRILTMHDGTFPALLKTLSDVSEEVIRCDLRLLSQISSASEDTYFSSFMANLLSLFSTDRRLLETRGSLIIRQLCASLHTDRVFRTLAELLEKDEDLEFASIMIQNLNIILITSPELADFRRRLKNHDSRDGQQLFTSLYRSWCHNAVATFSLCLLAQAYEHASNLLQVFADLEITVAMLIQIDKLVQLLESPIFTALRLQLLDPDKNAFLLKSLYGLLMLLPQSSAFATLRNRLSAVSSMGPGVRSTYAQTARSKVTTRDEIKWSELLTHFRLVQSRHERARRAGLNPALTTAAGTSASFAGLGVQEALVPGMASGPTRIPSTASSGPVGARVASTTAAGGVKKRIGSQALGSTSSNQHPAYFAPVGGAGSRSSSMMHNVAGASQVSTGSRITPSAFGLQPTANMLSPSGTSTAQRATSPVTGVRAKQSQTVTSSSPPPQSIGSTQSRINPLKR